MKSQLHIIYEDGTVLTFSTLKQALAHVDGDAVLEGYDENGMVYDMDVSPGDTVQSVHRNMAYADQDQSEARIMAGMAHGQQGLDDYYGVEHEED